MTKTKLTAALTGAAIVAATFAPAAFAEDIEIVDNGAFSHNSVTENNSNTTVVSQSSSTTAVTTVSSVANTGGNNSSFNTGGNNSITTGDATNVTEISVTGGSNLAVVAPDCGCLNLLPTSVTIGGNGAFSWNKVKLNNTNVKTVGQSTTTTGITTVVNKAKTGKNTSSFNTGGTNTITTGPASNGTGVTVTGGSNTSM